MIDKLILQGEVTAFIRQAPWIKFAQHISEIIDRLRLPDIHCKEMWV